MTPCSASSVRRCALVIRLLCLFQAALGGQRTFTIVNSCTFTLWPAVTNYVQPATNEGYAGVRGWEAPPGNKTTITITSPWDGRIWARRDCTFDDNGSGNCTTGDAPGGLEPDDLTIGNVNLGEWNLDAWDGNDFWDISAVPGWTVPMSIEPDGCDSLSCTEDVLSKCPDDRMKQKDSEGQVIGCLSACMAGINATEPSMNCCSGEYDDSATCLSSEVDYYDVLKPLCENAYWYPFDDQSGYPTVDYTCPSAGDPGYTVTFCPSGSSTTASSATTASSEATSTDDGQAESTTSPLVQSRIEAAATKSSSTDAFETTTGGSITSASGGSPKQQTTGASATSYTDVTSTPAVAAQSSNEQSILGVSTPVAIAITGGAAFLVLIGLGVACFRHSSNGRTVVASSMSKAAIHSDTDTEAEEYEPSQHLVRKQLHL